MIVNSLIHIRILITHPVGAKPFAFRHFQQLQMSRHRGHLRIYENHIVVLHNADLVLELFLGFHGGGVLSIAIFETGLAVFH